MRRLGSVAVLVVALGAVTTASVRSLAGAVSTVVNVARELTPREQAAHVLNRLAFCPRPGDVDRVMRMGVDRWVEQQLRPERIADHAMDQALAAFPTIHLSADRLLAEYPPPGAQLVRNRLRGDTMVSREDSIALRREAQRNRQFVSDLVSAKVARALASERQLAEVMVDFWENHFNVFIGKGQVRYYLADYARDAIRPNALGNFRELLGAVARSPAMLFYLDNAQSVADPGQPVLGIRGERVLRPRAPPGRQLPQRARGLNENYARELLELHTLGVDGGYTQNDVIEVARALTGWSINPPRTGRAGFLFRAQAHDAGAKVVLGHTLPAGRGIEDGEHVLDIVSRHPSTARFIARKLATRFVSDDPPPGLVDRAAQTFMRTNGNIREVVRTIVTSDEFFSRAAYRAKVKSPFEVTVSALRGLGARPDTTPISAGLVSRLGQPIYGHQAPNGWPETGAAWMNTGAILNRINFGLMVATGRIPGASLSNWPPYDSLVRAPRERQVDAVIASLLDGRASPDTREILMSGSNPLLENAGPDSGGLRFDDPVTPPAMNGVEGRRQGSRPGRGGRGRGAGLGGTAALSGLAQIMGLALGSPEFQRR